MNLQYQQPNGMWLDCEERTEEFLELCVKFGGLGDRDSTVAALQSGATVRNDRDDWFSNCRIRPINTRAVAAPAVKILVCPCCGNSGVAGNYPFSTAVAGGLCDDCV